MLSLHGCFYLRVIPEVDRNEPPRIISPEENPQVVRVFSDQVTLPVIASDPDGDEVFCEWPDLANVPATIERRPQREIWLCSATITDLDVLPGDTIRALVFDGDRDNVVTQRFTLVLP